MSYVTKKKDFLYREIISIYGVSLCVFYNGSSQKDVIEMRF